MIERIVAFALRQRIVILVATALLIIVGEEAVRRVPIEAYPDVADTWVQVIVQWPGHAPEEVERLITIPTERAMGSVASKRVIRSTTVAGLSVTTLLFEEGTDTFFARQQVDERMNSIDYPDDARTALGPVSSPVGEILRYRLVDCAITQASECLPDDMGLPPKALADLKDLEEFLVERELTSTPGIADVVSFGGPIREYQVLVDPVKLASFNVTFVDVENALRAANGNAGGGAVTMGPQSFNVRGVGLLKPEQIGEVALTNQGGTVVRVRQVASVVAGHKPRLGRVSVNEDDDVIAATVLLRKGQETESALAALHERIADVNARVLPRGVKISPYHDRTELLKATTHTVMKNLIEGTVLVTLILFIFLGNTRAALIVACTIPLALLFTFTCLGAVGVPANLLSMGALDFGMIVDGAIVMVENVHRELIKPQNQNLDKEARSDLVKRASREVSRPIVFAITILVTSYLPIMLLQRVEGKLFRPLAITVGFALVGSLLLTVTIVPVLASYFLKPGRRDRKRAEKTGPIDPHAEHAEETHNFFLRHLAHWYLPTLKRALKRPKMLIAIAAVLIVGEGVLTHFIGTEFLPHLDEGALWLRVTMPTNVSLVEAQEMADGMHLPGKRDQLGVREMLSAYPEVRTLAVQIGRPDDGTDPVGFYNLEFLMVLLPKDEWRKELHEDKELLVLDIAHKLDAIPGVTYGFSQPISDNVEEAITGVKGQLAIKIIGDDLQSLDDLADQSAQAIRNVPGVADLGIIRQLGQSNIEVKIARDRAERYGLDVAEVEDAVEHGIGGSKVTQIFGGEWRHDLIVRFAEDVRSDIGAIRQLLLPTAGGHLVPLSQVADVVVRGGASRIFREDGRRTLAIKFEVRGRDLGSTVDEAQARVREKVKLPPGYEMRWAGEFESARRAGARLAIVVPLTLLLIFVLLFALFRNIRDAAMVLGNVMVASPIGGLAALLISGHQLSVSSAVGFLALFGVSVQIGVLLVSYIDDLRKQGISIDDAIMRAAEVRLPPIVMMALVATLGLVPAALSRGIGSDSQKPLAIVVVGGLFCSLAISLFTVPLTYKLFARREASREKSL
jgi:cobalt-zinc-cadmium resistance protein CzcA